MWVAFWSVKLLKQIGFAVLRQVQSIIQFTNDLHKDKTETKIIQHNLKATSLSAF